MNDRWTQLEQSTIDRPRKRIHPEGIQNLFLQLSHPDRRRQLALILPAGTSVGTATQSTRALTVCETYYPGSTSLVIELCDPDLDQVFDALVDDVASQVAASDSSETAVDILAVRLAHWTDLFRHLGSSPSLNDDERRGLFGELHILSGLTELVGTSAATAWTGPDAASQDFQLGPVSIEVKTTARTLPHTMQIPNERELDGEGLEHLILTRLVVSEYPVGGPGVSLNDMVAAIRASLCTNPSHLNSFDSSLARTGYAPGTEFDAPLYAVRAEAHWDIRDDFPRITAADLRPGVADVHYTIDPTGFTTHQITCEDVGHIISGLA